MLPATETRRQPKVRWSAGCAADPVDRHRPRECRGFRDNKTTARTHPGRRAARARGLRPSSGHTRRARRRAVPGCQAAPALHISVTFSQPWACAVTRALSRGDCERSRPIRLPRGPIALTIGATLAPTSGTLRASVPTTCRRKRRSTQFVMLRRRGADRASPAMGPEERDAWRP